MGVTRIVPYLQSDDFDATKDFYVGVLGLTVAMEEPEGGDFLGLASPVNPSAQIVVAAPGVERPLPNFGIDVGDPGAVDAAHAEVVRRGLEVVYPPTDEPWGVRRFFVQDPHGTVISVLAHIAAEGATQ
jgi:catechol 2,3-dioxygenase-like lactoylglutathione lyase family enzyme